MGDRFACSIKGMRSARVVREDWATVMNGLVMTGAARWPFSLLAWLANERSCIDKLITTTTNAQLSQVPPPAIHRSMSRGLRRTDRLIQIPRIVPEAISRRTVLSDTLRILAA